MDFTAILDISAIIWDREDYAANTARYYDLAGEVDHLFNILKRERPLFLLRDELLAEMVNGFPFDSMDQQNFHDFGSKVYTFLTDIADRSVSFPAASEDVISIPNLIKEHYNNETKAEASYLISRIHSGSDKDLTYFTCEYLWGASTENLTTVLNETHRVECETILSDRGSLLEDFLQRFRKVFEHSVKHDRRVGHKNHKGASIAVLSCFDGTDNSIPQDLLETGLSIGQRVYNFDTVNDTFVVFLRTRANLYHGFDLCNRDLIPHQIRKHFNK